MKNQTPLTLIKNICITVSMALLLFLGVLIMVNSISNIPAATTIFMNRNVTLTVFILACLMTTLILLLIKTFGKLSPSSCSYLSFGLLAVILVVQVVWILWSKVYVVYDNMLVFDQALFMQDNYFIDSDYYYNYFSKYVHNLPVLMVMYYFLGIGQRLGIENLSLLCALLGVVMMDIAILLARAIAVHIGGKRTGLCFMILCLFSPITYIWPQWHYTTVISMPFFIGCIYLCLKLMRAKGVKQHLFYSVLLGVCFCFGFKIRSTLIIAAIAMVICCLFSTQVRAKGIKILSLCLLTFLTIFSTTYMSTKNLEQQHINYDGSAYAFPVTHYIMMGLGETATFNWNDMVYTSQFPTKEEKTAANIEKIKERLSNRGVLGTLDFMGYKLSVTWSDGSGGMETNWFMPKEHSSVYTYLYGDKKDIFLLYCQAYYVMILFFALWTVFGIFREKKMNTLYFIALILLGNMLFYLLWEAQSRYSVGFYLIFLLLAVHSLEGGYTFVLPTLRQKVYSLYIRLVMPLIMLLTLCTGIYYYDIATKLPWNFRTYSVRSDYSPQTSIGMDESQMVLEQTFTTGTPFDRISFSMYPVNIYGIIASYNMQLLDESNTVLYEHVIPEGPLYEILQEVNFDTVVPQGKQTYKLRIFSETATQEDYVILPTYGGSVDIYPGGTLAVGDVDTGNDLLFSVYNQQVTAYVSKPIYLLIIGLVLGLELCFCLYFRKCSKLLEEK